ncbi:uncharacterized protein KNAG_0A00100 [Huiozyma naganishii CBS 8797]|uniref:Uncharacterized protein n=1 Tax=Huiozyma naganishii (strain ATCC MYA-139 / BCRC 22969 / CBS 8797 / KCTC 17520 / NBRC 10181 / NCYC 3082 / Yp74L-3) TaxID=1071383 RepID=J7RSZ1_HUIN7|nr:hypothetical protein KNAG_0A00100 [Kazachstania naganishii CBS 8797]CCK67802.1 hypothetical protein KNAG_0A00100 [Kazachstania naganishii CBS 8797]
MVTVKDGKGFGESGHNTLIITGLDNLVTPCNIVKKEATVIDTGTQRPCSAFVFNGLFSHVPEPETTTEVLGSTLAVEYVTSYSRIEKNGTCGFGSTVYSTTYSTSISVNPSSHISSSVSLSVSHSFRTSLVSSTSVASSRRHSSSRGVSSTPSVSGSSRSSANGESVRSSNPVTLSVVPLSPPVPLSWDTDRGTVTVPFLHQLEESLQLRNQKRKQGNHSTDRKQTHCLRRLRVPSRTPK